MRTPTVMSSCYDMRQISGRYLLAGERVREYSQLLYFGIHHDQPDVAIGEDISCPNFFPIGETWMLLCISHPFGYRYYIGDWDEGQEQFEPESHGRMNWRRPVSVSSELL